MAMNLFSKIKNLLARGVVTLLESGGYQVTLLSGETRSNLEHLQEFGLASVKPTGVNGNGICIFYGGNRSNGSLLVMEFPDIKPTLEAGESALFNAFNAIVKLTKDGDVEATGNIVKLIGTTYVELNGTANGGMIQITALTDKINELVAAYNLHQHTYINSDVGPLSTTLMSVPADPLVKTDYENTKVVH
jgi:phage gp45-like